MHLDANGNSDVVPLMRFAKSESTLKSCRVVKQLKAVPRKANMESLKQSATLLIICGQTLLHLFH